MFPYTRYFILIVAAVFLAFSLAVSTAPRVEVVASDFDRPWSIAWINPTEVLITERSGQLIHLNLTSKQRKSIKNVPSVTAIGQGGLLDVQVTNINNELWVYLALAGVRPDRTTRTELWRARLIDDALVDTERLYALPLTTTSGHHFGGRIALSEQHVYLTIGDRGERERAQDLSDAAGSIIRLNLDGSVPFDNPVFVSNTARPELYSVGHRIKALHLTLKVISSSMNMARKAVMKSIESTRVKTMVGQPLLMDAITESAHRSVRELKKMDWSSHCSIGTHRLRHQE